jgi:hypothetical protein
MMAAAQRLRSQARMVTQGNRWNLSHLSIPGSGSSAARRNMMCPIAVRWNSHGASTRFPSHLFIGFRSQAMYYSSHPKEEITPKDGSPETVASAENNRSKASTSLVLAKSKEPGTTEKALRLLQEMLQSFRHGNVGGEVPDVTILEAVLGALAKLPRGDNKAAALQAQALFSDMISVYQSSHDSRLLPSVACYHDLIAIWSRASKPEQAERVFWELVDPESSRDNRKSSRNENTPSAAITRMSACKAQRAQLGQSLNLVLQSWAKSKNPEAGKRCDSLLSRLDRVKLPKGIAVKPNPKSYHLLCSAWCPSVISPKDLTSKNPMKYYNRVGARVQAILDFMLNRYQATNSPEWVPDPDVYPWLILAWGYAGAPEKAQRVLETMIKNSSGSNSTTTLPTTEAYNHVLEAWACQGKPFEAARLLSSWVSRCQEELEKRRSTPPSDANPLTMPDHTSCLLVIRAWGQFSDWNYASSAEAIVHRMRELQDAPKEHLRVLPAPTVETYNAVLEAWSRSYHRKPISNAERLLQEMHDHKSHNRSNPCAPNARSYELLIETYARFGAGNSHRARVVKKLVRQMTHYGFQPSERLLELVDQCQKLDYSLR